MKRPRLLFLSSVPRGQAALDVLREIEEIRRRIGDVIELDVHHCVTPRGLQPLIERAQPDIVQITAHGAANGRLILEGHPRDHLVIDGPVLAQICGAVPTIKLVTLRSCHSFPLAHEVAKRVGMAIGMSHTVDDNATIAFAAALYQAISGGLGVVESFSRALRTYEAYSAEPTTGPQLATAGPSSDHRFVDAGPPRRLARVQPCLVAPLDRPPRRPYIAPHQLFASLHQIVSQRSASVLNLVGAAGMGKTVGLTRWLAQLRRRHFSGIERVFAWSFDHDDTPAARCSAATRCAVAALKYFADDRDGELALSTPGQTNLVGWALGQRLAQLLQRRRSLLVLDGVTSPVQHPVPRSDGTALDPVLDGLLHELALLDRPYGSLVVLSSRAPLWPESRRPGFVRHDLAPLNLDEAQRLLRRLGVGGHAAAVREVATRANQHPFALSLMAHELVYHHRGDARAAPALGGEARGLAWALRCYGAGLGVVEHENLHRIILGQSVAVVDDEGLGCYLRDYLVSSDVARVQDPTLEVHATLRHYLEQTSPLARDTWDARYHHATEHAIVSEPAALRRREAMPPVLNAIVYATRAGRWGEALDLYFRKFVGSVQRPLLTREYGMILPALLAIQQFFRPGWEPAWPQLPPATTAILLHHAGLALRHLGCTQAAVEPLRRALDLFLGHPSGHDIVPPERAATCANDLAEVFIGLGRLEQALKTVDVGEGLATALPAESDGIPHALTLNIATRAEILRLRGDHEGARAAFERLLPLFDVDQTTSVDRVPQSRPGYYWWRWQIDELGRLTGPARTEAAARLRGLLGEAGGWSERTTVARITRALVWLCEAGFWLAQASTLDPVEAADALACAQQALALAARRIRETEHIWLLPAVYVATARLRRLSGDTNGAALDLRRASELANRCDLKLVGVDATIESAELERALYAQDADPKHVHGISESLERARRRISVTDYKVRQPDCEALHRWLSANNPEWSASM